MELTYNTNIFGEYDQTISYKEWKELVNNDPIFNDIYDKVILFTSDTNYIRSSCRNMIKYILSFYLFPQNHNDITYSSLYSRFCHLESSEIHYILHELFLYGIIREVRRYNRKYYPFTDEIESLIRRELNLNKILSQ